MSTKINITAFDALFNASTKEINASRLAKTKKANLKVIENAIDFADGQIDDAEDAINAANLVVAKGGKLNPQVIVDNYTIINKAKEVIENLTQFKDDFFREVTIEGKGRQRTVTEKGAETAE